jgi:hypothetical protein
MKLHKFFVIVTVLGIAFLVFKKVKSAKQRAMMLGDSQESQEEKRRPLLERLLGVGVKPDYVGDQSVYNLQLKLNSFGAVLVLDGIYGPKTKAAEMKYKTQLNAVNNKPIVYTPSLYDIG